MKRKAFLLKSLVLTVALLVFLALALVGCGGDDETTPSSGAPAGDSSTADSSQTAESTGDSSVGTDSSADNSSTDGDSSADNPGSTDSSKNDPPADQECEHVWKVESRTESTCAADGAEVSKCEKCGTTKTETLPKNDEHNYKVTEEIAATCQEFSKTVKTCETCGDIQEIIGTEKASHKGVEKVTLEPTCTTDGQRDYVCEVCNTVMFKVGMEKVIPALGHDEKENVVSPTCTEAGITNITCSRCDYTATKDETEAVGHSYTQLVDTIAPTCAEGGYDVFKCVRCDSTQNVSNDQVATGNHVLEYFKTVKPTCSVVGHKLYKCKTCDLTWKNPDLNTPNEPLDEDIVATVDHNYDYATVDGLVACVMCGKGYRDVTVEFAEGNDGFCMGCGKDPCECGSTGEWSGYTPAKAPEQLTAAAMFTKTEVALSSGNAPLQIGGGLIILTGEAETTYTVVIYAAADGEAVGTIEISGDYVLVFLDAYESVVKVEITASTDATASFYVAE